MAFMPAGGACLTLRAKTCVFPKPTYKHKVILELCGKKLSKSKHTACNQALSYTDDQLQATVY